MRTVGVAPLHSRYIGTIDLYCRGPRFPPVQRDTLNPEPNVTVTMFRTEGERITYQSAEVATMTEAEREAERRGFKNYRVPVDGGVERHYYLPGTGWVTL